MCGVLAGSDKLKFKKFLNHLKYTFFFKPDFVCYNLKTIDDKVIRKTKHKKIPLYIYTIRDPKDLKLASALSETVVIEGIDPNKKTS